MVTETQTDWTKLADELAELLNQVNEELDKFSPKWTPPEQRVWHYGVDDLWDEDPSIAVIDTGDGDFEYIPVLDAIIYCREWLAGLPALWDKLRTDYGLTEKSQVEDALDMLDTPYFEFGNDLALLANRRTETDDD